MKDFISSTLLVVASLIGAAAAADSFSSSTPRDVLAKLSALLQNPDANGDEIHAGDFADALACTADLSTGDVTDVAGCATATDAGGAPCVWCDASAILGSEQGVCVSPDIKSMVGQFWDQLCADAGSGPAPTPPVPATPPPTPAPTPNPMEPAPVPVPDDDDGNVPDALKCSVDASSNLITDEATCVAKKDATSATGEHCVWCSVPLLGGGCITNSDGSSVSFLCSGEGERGGKYLRGDGGGGAGWKALDPSCLGDGLAGGTRESCGARVDSNGEKCVWCDAGDDVFGICATPSQKGYIGSYMDCADVESAPVAAVE